MAPLCCWLKYRRWAGKSQVKTLRLRLRPPGVCVYDGVGFDPPCAAGHGCGSGAPLEPHSLPHPFESSPSPKAKNKATRRACGPQGGACKLGWDSTRAAARAMGAALRLRRSLIHSRTRSNPTVSNEPKTNATRGWLCFWRRRWDSNPRALSRKLISSQPRYDHFDTSPSRG